MILLVLAACTPPAVLGRQPPVRAHLVVHVDPLARRGGGGCATEGFTDCGGFIGESWERRTRNLEWLLARWTERDRAVDVELGPEMALAWSDDAEVQDALALDLATFGDADGAMLSETAARARVEDRAAAARDALGDSISGGAASIGVHVHSILPDGPGSWGTAPKGSGGAGPCAGWEGDPMGEGEPAIVEAVASWGAVSGTALAERLDADLVTYTGHLPRSMDGKIRMVETPDSLDPATSRAFPARFRPNALGSAYSECLLQSVDHPPFEPWPASADEALARGDGPPVIPGERVAGSMAEHLGAPSDGAAEAAIRRLVELLVNWRYEALRGGPDRPWTWTWHVHLFQLEPGEPDPSDPAARELVPMEGTAFRPDVEAVAAFLDDLAARSSWGGAESTRGGVARWTLPEDLETEGSLFDYSVDGAPPPDGMDRGAYPYLPLLAERLADTHLACRGPLEGVEVFGFERCAAGWSWGQPRRGYGCADGGEPEAVFLFVPEGPACVDVPAGALRAAPVDGEGMGEPLWCGGGVEVPVQGLIVEPAGGTGWLGGGCG